MLRNITLELVITEFSITDFSDIGTSNVLTNLSVFVGLCGKVSQLKILTEESWIAIDHSKRRPSNPKVFLTKEGKKFIQNQKKDFQFILLVKETYVYVFTSEAKRYQKLRREAIIKGVNKVMRSVSKQLPW